MTLYDDFFMTVSVQAGAFLVASYLAWRDGRPLNPSVRKIFNWLPYGCLGMFAVCTIGVVCETDAFVARHPWTHLNDIIGAALWFSGALFAMAFARIGPFLIDAGIKH